VPPNSIIFAIIFIEYSENVQSDSVVAGHNTEQKGLICGRMMNIE